jgi:hypothetical protein
VATDETILEETEGGEADEGCGGGKAYAKEGEGSSSSGGSEGKTRFVGGAEVSVLSMGSKGSEGKKSGV